MFVNPLGVHSFFEGGVYFFWSDNEGCVEVEAMLSEKKNYVMC